MMTSNSLSALEFDQRYAAEQLRRSRHPLRRFVKGFYLRNVLRDVRGPCIDYGCGAGQLLRAMHPGSVGLEVNPHLIAALCASGLVVYPARAEMSDFELREFPAGVFKTLVISHVLEHLPDPAAALRVLLSACERLGIERVIAVVPGEKGFAFDATHKTFIDSAWVDQHLRSLGAGFKLVNRSYFPGPWSWIGRYFVFHEMKLVLDRTMITG